MFFRNKESPSIDKQVTEGLCHDLAAGDHVLRWSNVLIYPIQIHGVVLSAGAGIVTIIDFGYSSSNQEHIAELNDEYRDRRLNIITLTEQKEVEQWKKVDYGKSLLSDGKWSKILSWFKKEEKESCENCSAKFNLPQSPGREASPSASSDQPHAPPDELFAQQKKTEGIISWLHTSAGQSDDVKESLTAPRYVSLLDQEDEDDDADDDSSKIEEEFFHDDPNDYHPPANGTGGKSSTKRSATPRLPNSDPPAIVLSRVRFLLSDEGRNALPPHHMLYANSECIAVWCKTGRFSTIQSQVFLHSTALGNAKTATTVALLVSAQTVTVSSTVPAAGFWGWLGYTTTTTSQVGLLSVNPWLIPVLAGYGIAAIGTPYFILHQAQGKWNRATTTLNDTFWQNAAPDVYVDAIQHWSQIF